MNTIQIQNFLHRHNKTRNVFIDCVSADKIPLSDHYPYACVINTDTSTKPGSHWVAIFVLSKNSIEYFDSLGREPNVHISKYLSLFLHVKVQTRAIQGLLTDICGQYCIYFIIQRASGYKYEEIVGSLLKNPKCDLLVESYVKYGARTA